MNETNSGNLRQREMLYWAAVVIALVLVVLDIIGKGAAWTNIGAFVFIAAAVFLRPGGLTRGRG